MLTSFSMTPGAIAALTSAALRTLGRFETGALKMPVVTAISNYFAACMQRAGEDAEPEGGLD
jgi:hypothetical protein